jgi:hypothetical protein
MVAEKKIIKIYPFQGFCLRFLIQFYAKRFLIQFYAKMFYLINLYQFFKSTGVKIRCQEGEKPFFILLNG